jgi:hypothetical protein
MPNMTLSVDEELYEIIKSHPEVKWSAIARKAMKEYAHRLKILNRIAAKSKLTEKDVEEIDKILKRAVAERHGI